MTHGIDFLLDQYCVLICMHRMALVFFLFVFLIYHMEQASLPISSSLYVFVVLYMCVCVSGLTPSGWEEETERETTPCLRFVSFRGFRFGPSYKSVYIRLRGLLLLARADFEPSRSAVNEYWITLRNAHPCLCVSCFLCIFIRAVIRDAVVLGGQQETQASVV